MGGYTKDVLENWGAELQPACPDTPPHNGVSEGYNQTIINKTRAYAYDLKLPENMWDLAVSAAAYAYNRTPHAANGMIPLLQRFSSDYKFDITQIKRFGCVAFIKVQRKTGTKFKYVGRRVIPIGYTRTGYLFLKPEDGKFYESRDARFNEKLVYGDKYNTSSVKN